MAATDRSGTSGNAPTYPAASAFAITPNDSAELDTVTRYIYVGTAGNLKVVMMNGETVTLNNLAAGTPHPLRVRKVFANGTSATNIVGLY